MERLGNLLFELSNEERISILKCLKENALNLTQVSKEIGLSTQQTSRHLSRLLNASLIQRQPTGEYVITRLGDLVLLQLDELLFSTSNERYLLHHDFQFLPNQFVKRLSELSQATFYDNVLDFIRKVEEVIQNAEEYTWLNVDQYSSLALNQIIDAVDRGVDVRILEKKETGSGFIDSTNGDQNIIYRESDEKQVFLIVTEKQAVFSLQNNEGEYDYRGFMGDDPLSHDFCRELYDYLWDNSEPRLIDKIRSEKVLHSKQGKPVGGTILVEGKDDHTTDRQAIQYAVDNYDEVILSGNFNLGVETETATVEVGSDSINHWSTSISLSRSVKITGILDDDNVSQTKLFKQAWPFPTQNSESYSIFQVNGENIDVVIENLNITNFNGNAVVTVKGNSLSLRNNRVTVDTGVGKGVYFGNMGDSLTGFSIWGYQKEGGFPGGIEIVGNSLDFAVSMRGGYIVPGSSNDPFYRPSLLEHEGYIGIGIQVQNIKGDVLIKDNVIKNMNSRGIIVIDQLSSSQVVIKNNQILSDICGSYAWFSKHSGFGVFVQSSLLVERPGFEIHIQDNTIEASKVNYSGIGVYGPVHKNGDKLVNGSVIGNNISLADGMTGIQVRKCDGFLIEGNTISGKTYYGISLSGRRPASGKNLGSNFNEVIHNDLDSLELKIADLYGGSNVDEKDFTGTQGELSPAHIWLNQYSNYNRILSKPDEKIINHGKDNVFENY